MIKFAQTCILTALAFSLVEQPVFAQYWGYTVNSTVNNLFWPISAAIGGNRMAGYRGYGYGNGAYLAGSLISTAGYALNTIPRIQFSKQQQKDYQSYNEYLRQKQVRANLYTNGYAGVPGSYPGVPSRFPGVPTAAGPPLGYPDLANADVSGSYAAGPLVDPLMSAYAPTPAPNYAAGSKKTKAKKNEDVLPVATPGQNVPLSMYPQIGPKPIQSPFLTPQSTAASQTNTAALPVVTTTRANSAEQANLADQTKLALIPNTGLVAGETKRKKTSKRRKEQGSGAQSVNGYTMGSTPLATGFVDAVNNNFGGNISQALFDPEMRSWAKSIGLIKASDDLVDTNLGGERVALIKSILADGSETPAAKLETVRLLLKH
jgi:hypothetical protein